MATGKPRIFFRLECLAKIIGVILVAGAVLISVEAIAWSMVISAWLSCILISAKAGNLIGYGFCNQVRDLTPALIPAALMTAILWMMEPVFDNVLPVTKLASEVFAGVFVFAGFAVIFNPGAIREIRSILLEHRVQVAPK